MDDDVREVKKIGEEVRAAEQKDEPEEEPFGGNDFPTEEPIFDYAEPTVEEFEREEPKKPIKNEVKEVKVDPVPSDASADMVFGKFMRALRKRSSSGVLFTMCSDLEFFFEGATLVLATTSETIFRALKREDHEKVMKEVFDGLGVAFEVRQKAAAVETKRGISELEQNFSEYTVQVKEK